MSNRSVHDRLEERLQEMQNKSFMYMGRVEKILSWKYEAGMCTVVTSLRWKTETEADWFKLLQNDFLETDEEAEGDTNALGPSSASEAVVVPQLQLKALTKLDDILDLLTRAADELEHNKEYKDQADGIAQISGKVVDIAKVQLDAYRLARDIHRNR